MIECARQATRIKEHDDVGKLAKADQYLSQVKKLNYLHSSEYHGSLLDYDDSAFVRTPELHDLPSKAGAGY